MQPSSPKIWAYLGGAFWVSFVTYYVLWKSYKRIVALRIAQNSSLVATPEQYAVLVRDIPKPDKHESRTEEVDSFFRKVHPAAYERCMVVNDLKSVRTNIM